MKIQGGYVINTLDLWIKNWKWRSRSWELPFEFQTHHVQSILAFSGKPLFERCRRESKWKPHKTRKLEYTKKTQSEHKWSPRSQIGVPEKPPKDGNESQTHGLSDALLHSSVRKSWNRPHLFSKSDPKSNFRVFRGFHLISRRHRSNSGFPSDPRMDWTWWIWNPKGSSQLLDLPFQFLIQRSTC